MSLYIQLIKLIQMLIPSVRSQQDHDQAYLSMREIDRRNRQAAPGRAFSQRTQ
jgi:hypothetical protein